MTRIVAPGLEGVVAFETEIAEPDRDGGALRYRGVDIEELVGGVPFEGVWGLLVDGLTTPGLPLAEPYDLPAATGDPVADLQAATARLSAAWKLGKIIDISDYQAREDLRRASATMLAIVAQSARLNDGESSRVDRRTIEAGSTAAERFLLEWRGEVDPRHARAIDTYWICTAEHGMNASTFTARVVASTGADCAAALSSAVGALSGPLHGGAPARVLPMLDAAAASDSVEGYVRQLLDSKERLMGFGHRVYRAEDPRARVLRRTARELDSPRFEVAEALEKAALDELRARHPERVLATNVEFWSAVVLDCRGDPPGHDARDVRELSNGRLVCPHPRTEADRQADPTVRRLRRSGGTIASVCHRPVGIGATLRRNCHAGRMRVLFATAELSPMARVGGLAEAASGLVRAFSATQPDVDCEVLAPDYSAVPLVSERVDDVDVPGWMGPTRVRRGLLEGFGQVSLVSYEGIARPHPYLNPNGTGFWDNDHRFIGFAMAVASIARATAPDILHLNDWHTAAALGALDPASAFPVCRSTTSPTRARPRRVARADRPAGERVRVA